MSKQLTATSGNIAVFDDAGVIADGGAAVAGLATAAQGAKADTAIQTVSISTGAANGTVKLAVDGNDTEAAVKGLGTAAYQAATTFATADQGDKADSALQSVSITGGTNNGTIKLSTGNAQGTNTTDNIPVTGLGTAAYQAAEAFATSAQGAKSDTAVQSVSLAQGNVDGTLKLTVDGVSTTATVTGLGSAAYTESTSYATAAQGVAADSALQPENVVDNLTSTNPAVPLSANQGRVLNQKIEAVSSSGKPIGGFLTYADVYTNTSQFAADLQPINVNDTIYIAADENHTNMPTQHRVSSIDDNGGIIYSFVKIVPDTARDFSLNPITTNEIESGAVVSSTLADGSVLASKIQDGSVSKSKLSTSNQAAIDKANSSLQAPIATSGTGSVVTGVTQGAGNTLAVTYGNALDSVEISGTGDFVTDGSINGSTITLAKNGTAIKDVSETGSGNAVVAIIKDASGNLLVSKGNLLSGVSPNGTGNAVASISSNGGNVIPNMATLLSSITKSGSGNTITDVSTGPNGAVTLSSDTVLKTITTTGTGNAVTDITASSGTVTVTKGTVVTSIPAASTSQAGIVQLNDTLASSSVSQALTAKQGAALKTLIDTNNGGVVHLAGSETITGTKTFSSHPAVPSKSAIPATPSSTQYATEAQVNTRYAKVIGATPNNILAVGANSELIDSGLAYTSLVETTDTRLSDSRPASDVSAWAKAANKPSYTAAEVGADPAGTASAAVSTHNADSTAHPGKLNVADYNRIAYLPAKAVSGSSGSVAVALEENAFIYVIALSGTTTLSFNAAAMGATKRVVFRLELTTSAANVSVTFPAAEWPWGAPSIGAAGAYWFSVEGKYSGSAWSWTMEQIRGE